MGLRWMGSTGNPLGLEMVNVRYPEKCTNDAHLSIKPGHGTGSQELAVQA